MPQQRIRSQNICYSLKPQGYSETGLRSDLGGLQTSVSVWDPFCRQGWRPLRQRVCLCVYIYILYVYIYICVCLRSSGLLHANIPILIPSDARLPPDYQQMEATRSLMKVAHWRGRLITQHTVGVIPDSGW